MFVTDRQLGVVQVVGDGTMNIDRGRERDLWIDVYRAESVTGPVTGPVTGAVGADRPRTDRIHAGRDGAAACRGAHRCLVGLVAVATYRLIGAALRPS
ncbi:hypothetical protein [Rhodococcus jostii]|uniref:hypothetical protein n=1 Tax=Rhodococcus jostii TaxID=132919 RepID=UPI0002DAFD5C|nr:hypothetical protein [Rhodococcus jostii]